MSELTEFLPCQMTRADMDAVIGELTNFAHRLHELDEQRRQLLADLKRARAQAREEMTRLSVQIAEGVVYRDVPVRWVMGCPSPGEKALVRNDTNEILRTALMTDEDRQTMLPFLVKKETD